jgi:hypothetical protein
MGITINKKISTSQQLLKLESTHVPAKFRFQPNLERDTSISPKILEFVNIRTSMCVSMTDEEDIRREYRW